MSMKIVITKWRGKSKVELMKTNGQEAVEELAIAFAATANVVRKDSVSDAEYRRSLHDILDSALDSVQAGESTDASPE